MSFTSGVPDLNNNIGDDVPREQANDDFIKEAISNQHGWSDTDATACIHSGLVSFTSGLLADRPDTGTEDEMYFATDATRLYYGTGAGGAWNEISLTASGAYPVHAASHTDGTDDIQDSSTSQKGIVELATDAEADALVDTDRAIVPSSLKHAIQNGSYTIPIANLQAGGTWTLWDRLSLIGGLGGQQLLITNSTADSSNKQAVILSNQYDSETETEGWIVILIGSTVGENVVSIGGGGSGANTATKLRFITSSDTATRIGTIQLEIGSDGVATFTQTPVIPTKTPVSASDTGTTGQIAWDSDYIYICTATNTWKRTAISTW